MMFRTEFLNIFKKIKWITYFSNFFKTSYVKKTAIKNKNSKINNKCFFIKTKDPIPNELYKSFALRENCIFFLNIFGRHSLNKEKFSINTDLQLFFVLFRCFVSKICLVRNVVFVIFLFPFFLSFTFRRLQKFRFNVDNSFSDQ